MRGTPEADFESWVDAQVRRSAKGMLASISPLAIVKHRPGFGQTVRPVAGAIVASPVLADWDPDPDYFFHWFRDSALVIDALRSLYADRLVGMEAGLVSNSSPLFGWISNALTSPEQVCNSPDGNFLFFTERPVFSVTLRAGERTEILPFRFLYAGGEQTRDMLPFCDCQVLLDRTYYAPIWDRSWPDDTIVSFEYMGDAPPPQETTP